MPRRTARDLTGLTFGRWTVLRRAPRNRPRAPQYWLCQCACGHRSAVWQASLTHGRSTQCRRCAHKALVAGNTRHGLSGSRVANTWRRLMSDSADELPVAWRRLDHFAAAVGHPPPGPAALVRIDPTRPWSKSNARWFRGTPGPRRRFEFALGHCRTHSEWARLIGRSRERIRQLVQKYGSIQAMFTARPDLLPKAAKDRQPRKRIARSTSRSSKRRTPS